MANMRQLVQWGFRRWYERQLIESHAWLVSFFLCLILFVSGLEIAGNPGYANHLGGAFLAAIGAALGWFSVQRYRVMLELAERLGQDATCPTCGRYAKFEIESASPEGETPTSREVHVAAKCKHCASRWMLPHA